MSFWTFVFLCVIAGILYDLARKDKLGRLGGPAAKNPPGADREAQLALELEALRERIKVLERIATEDHEARRLSQDIERLRDHD